MDKLEFLFSHTPVYEWEYGRNKLIDPGISCKIIALGVKNGDIDNLIKQLELLKGQL